MIIIRMSGGLGNQMFQYALYLKLISLGREVSFDDKTEYAKAREGADKAGNERPIALPIFGIRYPRFAPEELVRLTDGDLSFPSRIRRKITGRRSLEKHDEDFVYDPSFLEQTEGYYTGCFQSPLYFQGAEEEVRKAFVFPEDMLTPGKETGCRGIAPLTKEQADAGLYYREAILRAGRSGNTCAIHLRFGDYLEKSDTYGGIATMAYYQSAIAYMQERIPLLTFFVFSNDTQRAISWVSQQAFPERFVVVTGNDEAHGYVDLYLMSLCRNYIICNSSFSFWGAWLGGADGTVIAPSYWINETDGSQLQRTDIFPASWVRINPSGQLVPGTGTPVPENEGQPLFLSGLSAGQKSVLYGTGGKADRPCVSVIIAAYNIETYIGRALQSLQHQTLRNMEFIVVDDGSTDQTGAICDTFAAKDARFHVIHKKNGGLSDARNAGLSVARGAWIGYLDGDDACRPEMYESMLTAAVMADADMALCAYQEMDNQSTRPAAASVSELTEEAKAAYRAEVQEDNPAGSAAGAAASAVRRSTVLTRDQALNIYVRSGVADDPSPRGINFYNSVWSKLFSRKVAGSLQFPVGRNSEDILYTTKALTNSDRVVYLPDPLYLYTVGRAGSIMNQKTGERRLRDEIPFYEEQLRLFSSLGLDQIEEKAAFYLARRLLFYWDDFDGTHEVEYRPYADAIRDKLLSNKAALQPILRRADYARPGDRKRLELFLTSPDLYRRFRDLYAKMHGGAPGGIRTV